MALGWLVANEDLVNLAAKAHTFSCIPSQSFLQVALSQVMQCTELENLIAKRRHIMKCKITKFIHSLRNTCGFSGVTNISGGFYLFININELQEKFEIPMLHADSSMNVAEFLLDRCKIAVVPGTAFGANGKDYVRMSLASTEEKLFEALQRLSNEFH